MLLDKEDLILSEIQAADEFDYSKELVEASQQIIEKHGSIENFWAKSRKENKSYSDSAKKQADLWKRIKDKKNA